MIQFYAPDILNYNCLPEGESAHCNRVLRMKEGEEIAVTDGKGYRYRCIIKKSHPLHTEFEVLSREILSCRPYKVTLAVAPTKNSDRMEWMAEKAVEIGIDRIVLLRCDRSERKIMKTERLQRVMIAAMKQSLSSKLPEITEIVDFKEYVTKVIESSQKFFGYCSDNYPKKNFVNECKAGLDVNIMIGPEGDFTDKEVLLAVDNGFIPVTFGEQRLRTETAGIFAVCAVDTLNQLS